MMYEDLKMINSFPKLLNYLRTHLDWPVEDYNIDDLTFEYDPSELGVSKEYQIKINNIQQLRPLTTSQPWGIFFVDFETKHLPVVLLRRLLTALIPKNRASAQKSNQPTWNLDDLLFISLLGEEDNRQICFSHFKESEQGLPVLQTFSWDERETHFYYIKKLNLENLRWPKDINNSELWKQGWSSAFAQAHGQLIKTSKHLSIELAKIAKSIRHTVDEIYKYETKKGRYHKLLEMFKEALIHDLEPSAFSDMVAQTITYGLFSASATGEKLSGISNLSDLIPNTNPFLKELFNELTAISDNDKKVNFDELGLNDLINILNETEMDAILQQFGRQTGGGSEDPVIHFYENFLKEYDNQQKIKRGVFYTPKSVVSFIVRSVHETIKREFGLEDGLADISTWSEAVLKNPSMKQPKDIDPEAPFVQILDPAVGTGTFLVEVIDVIFKTMVAKWESSGKNKSEITTEWENYVNNHLLNRIYGFELMMAPYSICHVKLGLILKTTGFDLKKAKQRFQIYLTNTLDEPQDLEAALFMPFLAKEAYLANSVKLNTPITVIVGNPPYSYKSSNLNIDAKRLVERYRYINNVKIKEKGALSAEKAIQDDYVKFLAFSQKIIEKNDVGIVGMITNSNFYQNPTLRGLRWSHLQAYSNLKLYDIGGQNKSGEKNDENVFDIVTGVAISIFCKLSTQTPKTSIGYLRGTRNEKYKNLLENNIFKIQLDELTVFPPLYLFKKYKKNPGEYFNWISINDLFKITSVGIKTNRDHLAIDFDKESLEKKYTKILDPKIPTDTVATELNIKNNAQWKFEDARKIFMKTYSSSNFTKVNHRPFDNRWIYYHPSIVHSPRPIVNKHVHHLENLCLISNRRIRTGVFNHHFVSNIIAMAEIISSADNSNIYPLYLYTEQDLLGDAKIYTSNFRKNIIEQIINSLRLNIIDIGSGDLENTIGPSDIFNYIYAILFSKSYKNKYNEFLIDDFPRIPFTNDIQIIKKLVTLGSKLITTHLLLSPIFKDLNLNFQQNGEGIINKPYYEEGKVYINKSQYFDGVPEVVWNLYIGSYQPAQKWLKDRKGRTLSNDDIKHYQKIIVALTETDRIIKEIDKVYPEVEKNLITFDLEKYKTEATSIKDDAKNIEILKIIQNGEGTNIEFKATLQKSLDNDQIPNSVMENNVLKTIAAFCNANGGDLLIGVGDNKEIVGIEQDNFETDDKFLNHLKNIIKNRVTNHVFTLINNSYFHNVNGKTIYHLICKKSSEPIYVEFEGKNHFYVRNLESTDSLDPQETVEYFRKRFR